MRLRRRFAAVTVALTLALGSMGLAATAEAHRRPPKPKDVQLQVLSFNDFHGHLQPPAGTDATLGAALDPSATPVGGAEYLASTLDRLRAKAKYSQTVTAGDLIGGSPFLSGLFHDEPAVESLNAMGLDVSSVGNHEFDEGVKELQRMQRGGCHPEDGCYAPWGAGGYPGADFPWLAANVVRERTGRTVLPGTWVTKVKGVKVGYIGMTLEDTPTLVAQSGIQGIEFRDEVQTANRAARDLRRRGVETIIVLLHEGGLQTGTYQQCTGISGPIVNIAKKLSPSIDLVVTGHTHQPYVCNIPDPAGKPRMVTSASSFGRVVTETTLTLDRRTGDVRRNKTTATNHLVTRTQRGPGPDRDHRPLERRVGPDRQPGGRLHHRRPHPVAEPRHRGGDGQRDRRRPAGRDPAAADGGAQIALMNPGGVRADLTYAQISGGEQPGQVTYGEAFAVQPFGNLLVTMDLTGAQLARAAGAAGRAGPARRTGRVDLRACRTASPSPTTRQGRSATGSIRPASSSTARHRPGGHLPDRDEQLPGRRRRRLHGVPRRHRPGRRRRRSEALTDYLARNSPVAPPADRIAGI